MELEKIIMEDLKDAMKSKNEAALRALRALKGAILTAKTEKNASEMDAQKEIQLIQKLVKQRKESFEIYSSQGMQELALKEKEEIDVLERYLPIQLSEEEVTVRVKAIMKDLSVSSAQEIGMVMKVASKELAGLTDGQTISRIAKSLLS